MDELLLFCRPGFEVEAGQEMTDALAEKSMAGYFRPDKGSGTVRFMLADGSVARDAMSAVGLDTRVFVRDWFPVSLSLDLPESDRVGAVLECLRAAGGNWQAGRVEVRVPESASTDLSVFARKWVAPLSQALRKTGFLGGADVAGERRLELFLPDFETALMGISKAPERSPFLSGAPRLKLPADAPSRSALKLEEAWKVLLSEYEQREWLSDGRQAVDLGAAPGGWTWQLVRRGMMVTAVDNGPMDEALMATGQVTHVQEDGYRWRPAHPVDWMVCDIVDRPRRTVDMVGDWLAAGLCRWSLFNLKLPMKQRYEEWLICRDLLLERASTEDFRVQLSARQLYHDREEITVLAVAY
ncbi:23S rRNA (cytidine2498-2'-O)-methyltransferase [Tamilnaduibacter salinus]|uniref:23S rRNA (Cytidine2498-2'-O)-methyltransferase n=1 Tax=Tamilnaduibacter salinus TaxID=1484056 RepID=A0A2U1CV13_9GAMM|nr:23S rRNA (cytidine(2498)-2'-O)-methyltransferase RlmM [Tamilnaduibacter salinus]PVY75365.1 23S rRNA (cytidine2498-2'-O)-methyltransferase [Tamilnaduibacter salinus]